MRKILVGLTAFILGLASVSPVGASFEGNISSGDAVSDPQEKHELIHQNDGNVVLYDEINNPIWHTKTHGKDTSRLAMQSDGNLVLYNSSNQPIWHSGTHGNPGAVLAIQGDGNLVIYKNNGSVAWAINHWPPKPPPPPPAPSAPAEPYGVWDRLAQCESHGEWNYGPHSNWGSKIYHGGLQFHPTTWSAHKLSGYPTYAYQASRYQQIQVGKRVLAAQGWIAWPSCSKQLGLR